MENQTDRDKTKIISPLPWHYELGQDSWVIYDVDGKEVATCSEDGGLNNADIIVKAVNKLGGPISRIFDGLNALRRAFTYQDDSVANLVHAMNHATEVLSRHLDYGAMYCTLSFDELNSAIEEMNKALGFFSQVHITKKETGNAD